MKVTFFGFALVLFLGAMPPVLAQVSNPGNFYLFDNPLPEDVPYYKVELINTIADSAGVSKLTIRLTFVNDELQFIKAGKKKFRADAEMSAVFFDTTGVPIDSTTWKHSVFTTNYRDTKSTKIKHSTQKAIELPPGEYKVVISLKDVETGRTGVRKGRVKVKNFDTGTLLISDMVLKDAGVDSAAVVSEDAPPPKNYWVKYEWYNIPAADSVRMKYQISLEDSIIQKGEHLVIGRGRITPDSIRIAGFTGFLSDMNMKIHLVYDGKTYDDEKLISCSCPGSQINFANIDEAVEQLVYIADKKELKNMEALKGQKKIKAFLDFWQKKDPTPGTVENEYLTEYYNRIAFANKRFRGTKDGWRTEMGMVFIKLGPPDYIDRPMNYNSYYDATVNQRPNLVWEYVNLRRRVVFVYRAGEYRIGNYNEVFDLLNGDIIF